VLYGFSAAILDDVLTGWVTSLDRVCTIVGGYFTSVSFALLLFAHGSHVFALFLDRFREGLKTMDYWKLLSVQLEHQSLMSLCSFPFSRGILGCSIFSLYYIYYLFFYTMLLQGHHMALAMEEHTTMEMLGHNNAIETLKRRLRS
jgi:hypothetical protein